MSRRDQGDQEGAGGRGHGRPPSRPLGAAGGAALNPSGPGMTHSSSAGPTLGRQGRGAPPAHPTPAFGFGMFGMPSGPGSIAGAAAAAASATVAVSVSASAASASGDDSLD